MNQRPTAMLCRDYYALNRNVYSGEPIVSESMWTDWDYALAESIQFIDDYTTAEGHLIWEAESERVTFNAKKKINKARAAIDRKTKGTEKNPYKVSDGEYWVTEPLLMRGDDWPTLSEWLDEQVRKNG
jgi:hypothetical protein